MLFIDIHILMYKWSIYYVYQINIHKVFNIISEVRVNFMLIIISNQYKIYMLLLNTLYIFVLSIKIVEIPYLVTHQKNIIK